MKPIPDRRGLAIGALIILFGAVAATSFGEELNKFRLTVKVVYANKQKVQGAVVTVTHDRFGPEVRPYDYRIETDPDGVASTVVTPNGWGEGVAYWPTLDIEAKKGARTAHTTIKVTGTRLSSGVRYADVETTLTIAGDEETERTKVNVAVSVNGDDSKPIPSVAISVKGPEGTYTGRTEADGKAGIAVPFIPKAEYWVSAIKRGYEPKDRLVLLGVSPGSSIEAPITLKKSATPDGIVVTINVKKQDSPDPVREAHIMISDTSGVVSDDYRKTTNSAGMAMVRLPGPGTYPISIEQEFFEPFQGKLQLSQGDEAKTFDYTLKEIGSEETIHITVLAGDIKNGLGSYEPISGASVTTSTSSGVTDGKGKVTINVKAGVTETDKGAGFAEAVDVTVSAKGYKSQTRPVQLKHPQHRNLPGSAAETFILELGEDKRSDKTPIKILVQVRDAIGPVPRALVALSSLGSGETGDNGERNFDSGNRSSEDMAALRKAITVTVTHRGHKPHQSTFTEDTPSNEVRRYSVSLDKDWGELTNAIIFLEQSIGAWKKDARAVSAKAKAVESLSEKCAAARGRGESLLAELKAAGKAAEALQSEAGCKEARELARSIEKWRDEAVEKEKTLRSTLDEAIRLSATCKSKSEADSIRAKHTTAIVIVVGLGKLEKQAIIANEKLTKLVQGPTGTVPISQLQGLVDKIEEELSAAGKDAAAADNAFDDLLSTSKSLPGIRAELLQALNNLRVDHHLRDYDRVLPEDLRKRLVSLEVLREGSADMSMSFAPSLDRSRLNVIKETVSKLQGYKDQAVEIIAGYKRALCDVKPLDEIVQEFGPIMAGATIELGAARDLTVKAAECEAAVAAASTALPPSNEVTVPDLKVFPSLPEMQAAVRRVGLVPILVAIKAAASGNELFAGQDPLPNTKLEKGRRVTIYVHQKAVEPPPPPPPPAPKSPPVVDYVIVPDLGGFDAIPEMQAVVRRAGLVPVLAASKKSVEGKKLFAGQNPLPNTKLEKGGTVTIYINQKAVETAASSPPSTSSPPPPPPKVLAGTMPDLIGLTLNQAVSSLPSNMRIGGDEVGDKPPSPEKAYRIFSQTPPAGSKVSPSEKVVVTVKRYGAADAAATSPIPATESSTTTAGGNFEGTWQGKLQSMGTAETVLEIRRAGNGYSVLWYPPNDRKSAGDYPGRIENGHLVFEFEFDLAKTVGAFGSSAAEMGEHYIYKFRYTCSVEGNTLHATMWARDTVKGEEGTVPNAGVLQRK